VFDVISSHFFVESATHDLATALTFARKCASVGRGDALVLLSFLQHATLWNCHDLAVRCLAMREGTIEDFLSNVGLTLTDAQVRTAPGRRPAAGGGRGLRRRRDRVGRAGAARMRCTVRRPRRAPAS
jgi:hypothetical protein